MRRKENLPEFKSVQEMAEFWDTHSVADYWDQLEPEEIELAPELTARAARKCADKERTETRE